MNRLGISVETLVVIIALVMIGAVTYWLAIPQAKSLKEQTTKLSQLQAQKKSLEDEKTQLDKLATVIPQYTQEIKSLAVAYPKSDQTIEALIQAKAIAERASLSITSLAPAAPKDGSVPVSFALHGAYSSIAALIAELNANLRPANVQSFSIAVGSDKDASLLALTLLANFDYNVAAEAAVATPAGAVPNAATGAAATGQSASPAPVASPGFK